ncbi:hypothetical protein B0H14DRAFT_3509873 [Mycena olivaceomarginata]|nr:hypothetical protein B0H14DRAFT_3509873 [Mycena olivaceomarginata]
MNIPNILPVLRVAQAAAAGNPVPGLDDVVALAEMVSTMNENEADLSDLIKAQDIDGN